MLARAMNHPTGCHGLSKNRARYECFAELMGVANRIEVDTTPYEMRLTQMGQNPLAARQNEPLY